MSTYLSRLGRFSARHRLVVVFAWLALFAGLTGILTANGGGENSADTIPDSRASQALDLMNEEFPSAAPPAGGTLQLVFHPDGAAVTDPAVAAEMSDLLAQAAQLPGVEAVSNPFDSERPFISPDASLAVATLSFGELSEEGQVASYDAAIALAESAPDNLGVELGGNLVPLGAPEQGVGEALGVLIAFLVLILTYGSLRAAGANLLVAVFGVGVGLVGVLAYGSISPIGENSIILAAMLCLAVGIDYSLFIFSRFQNELRAGRSVENAIARATGTAGTAVVFAGLTVIVALVALLVANIGFITQMGFAAAFGILISVLLSLTLGPVLMKTMGLKALSKKHRAALEAGELWTEDGPARNTRIRRWGALVVKRPAIALVAGVAVLLVIATPMLSMKTAFHVPGGVDPESTERTA